MKRTLCALLALLLLTMGCAALAETEDDGLKGFYLFERRLTQTENVCRLQLRLMKAGGIQYCLDELDVLLLDAEGNEIVPLTTEMIAPLNPVPAGDQYFHVTMVYTLPEGAAVADFRLLNIFGELFDEPSAEPAELQAGHILMHNSGGPAATCWLEKPVSDLRHMGHMMLLNIYDVEGAYLGTQAFSWEDADCVVDGRVAKSKLSELSGLPEDVIDYYGIEFKNYSNYYFFADVPLTGLLHDDIPASAEAETFRSKSPLKVLANSFEKLEDGRWRAYCLLQNGSCEPIDFNGHHPLIYDAAGELGGYTMLEIDCNLWDLEPFGFTTVQYTYSGLPEDFVPVEVQVFGKAIHKEASCTVKRLESEHFVVRMDNGRMLLDATIPEEMCGETDNLYLPPVCGLMWYARNPDDMSMISCGSVRHTVAGPMMTGSWYKYRSVEITGVPEGVIPDVLVFVMDTK